MGISLKKGQKVDLTKGNPGLSKVRIGLGWDMNRFDTGGAIDLDSSTFLLGSNGKVLGSECFIFYNQKTHPSGCIEHLGDNTSGAGDGDDEVLMVDLSKVPANIEKIAITVTIHEAQERGHNFGMMQEAYIRLYDEVKGVELMSYDLDEDFSIETAIVFGELYRHNGEWKFNAVGSGYQGGLAAMCSSYGIEVD